MLVSPGSAASGGADDFEDGVCAHRVVGEKANALAVDDVIWQRRGVDNILRDRWIARVLVDRFVENHHVAGWARTGRVRWVKNFPVVAHVVEEAVADGETASDQSEQSGKRIRIRGSASVGISDAVTAQFGKGRAGMSCDVVRNIQCV